MASRKLISASAAALLAVSLSFAAACGAQQGGAATSVQSNSTAQGAGQRVEISASKYEFKPRELKLKAGRPVTVVLTSTGGSQSFDVDELNLHSAEAAEGKTITYEFTPDKPGTDEFYCAHGGHKERGMTGRLEIAP
ncbi:MAG TPA: cupredoxin domain-containing protein [Pyrinomonadaceae bacterium]